MSSTTVASIREEIASALTHGLGAVFALAASAVLITLAAIYGDGWQLASAIVFGIALLLLYTASTLYHAIQHPTAKGRLKVFDHCAIYVLIAGTYTPFTLIGLRGPWGWGLFTAIWALALGGVVFKLFYTGRFKALSTGIYIAMRDPGLAVRRRPVLHAGHLLLPSRIDPLFARNLASVRDRRQRLPLRRGDHAGPVTLPAGAHVHTMHMSASRPVHPDGATMAA